MKRAHVIPVAVLSICLAGCVLKGKQPAAKAVPPAPKPVADTQPPPPPKTLSTPQTNIELPPPQPPPTAEALNPPMVAEEPATTPATPRSGSGRTGAPRPAAPKPEATPQGPPAPVAAQPAAPAPAADHPPLQEIVPAADQKRLQDEAANYKREIRQRLEQLGNRHLKAQEKTTQTRIASFLKESDAAAERGDWRSAAELAERALALARELTSGR